MRRGNRLNQSQPTAKAQSPKATPRAQLHDIKQSKRKRKGTRVRETKSPKKVSPKISAGTFREMFTQSLNFFL
jgi:hypothetical protein